MDKYTVPRIRTSARPCTILLPPSTLTTRPLCEFFLISSELLLGVKFFYDFLPVDGEFKAEHICLLCRITIRQFYPLHSLFGDFDPPKI